MEREEAVELVRAVCRTVANWQYAACRGRSPKGSAAAARAAVHRLLRELHDYKGPADNDDIDECLKDVGIV
jgi:hypothetical protein